MKRREFITLLGGAAAAAWPLAASAQQPGKLPTVGFSVGSTPSTEGQWVAAFATCVRERPDALFVGTDSFLNGRRIQLTHLASRQAIPAAYSNRDFAEAGGLMSYGANIADAWRQVGDYAGHILKGANPTDLPVVQSSKLELVINAQTAQMLGVTVPPTLLALADEVIE